VTKSRPGVAGVVRRGAGPVLAPRLLVAFGPDRARYDETRYVTALTQRHSPLATHLRSAA